MLINRCRGDFNRPFFEGNAQNYVEDRLDEPVINFSNWSRPTPTLHNYKKRRGGFHICPIGGNMKIGIDIGGSHIAFGLVNEELNIIDKIEKTHTEQEKQNLEETIINKIVLGVNEILNKNKLNINEIELIGIACAGTIKDGYIVKAENLKIYNFHIIENLQEVLKTKIIIRNDAKCAALAEKAIGGLKKYSDAIFITLGTGIGGAVFINNKLLEPKTYSGFEIGHTVIEKNGVLCNCGKNGCFENYASMKVLKNKIREQYNLSKDVHSKELMEILNNKTEKSNIILDEYIKNLSIGLTNLINIFEPEAISIGGSFSYYEEIFLVKLQREIVKENATFNNRKEIKILMAELKNDAGIIGAVI